MSKVSHHQRRPLEVVIMFEPHRLQDDLLREAYCALIPETRRRLSSRRQSFAGRCVPLSEGIERKIV